VGPVRRWNYAKGLRSTQFVGKMNEKKVIKKRAGSLPKQRQSQKKSKKKKKKVIEKMRLQKRHAQPHVVPRGKKKPNKKTRPPEDHS